MCLVGRRGNWVEELPSISWACQTTPWNSTKSMPFSQCYVLEAIILAKMGVPSFRVENDFAEANEDHLQQHLYFLDEQRD